jgi:hypothetical protein
MLATTNMDAQPDDCAAAEVECGNINARLALEIASTDSLQIYPQLIHKRLWIRCA